MKNYEVIEGSITIRSGIIGLSPAQAKDRAHAIKPLGDGLYEVLAPAQFKRGERFAYDGDANKALFQHIQETGQEGKSETATPPVTNPPNAKVKGKDK